ncbi:MAG: hypothetical protein JOZ81_06680 [Chloroflexi bacterium]|nr:hypothetical protein [Chloroflexota bacterium]
MRNWHGVLIGDELHQAIDAARGELGTACTVGEVAKLLPRHLEIELNEAASTRYYMTRGVINSRDDEAPA